MVHFRVITQKEKTPYCALIPLDIGTPPRARLLTGSFPPSSARRTERFFYFPIKKIFSHRKLFTRSPFVLSGINTNLFVIGAPPIGILTFAMFKQIGLLIPNPQYDPLLSYPHLAKPLVHTTLSYKTAALYSFSSGFLALKFRGTRFPVSPPG
jgi:hypothetical protein